MKERNVVITILLGARIPSTRLAPAALAEAGHLNKRGRPFNPRRTKAMIEG